MVDNSFTLENGTIYYISIRSTDDVGNVSVPISTDGITADHEGPFGFAATDGDSSDIDRQNYTDLYQGHWSMFEDLLSGLVFYETGLYDSTAGSYTLSWDSSGIDTLIEFTGLNGVPDPDLIIRSGSEKRISNFLLWQLSYAEVYFEECLWPDFDKGNLDNAIKDFMERSRRYGNVISGIN